MTIHIEKRDAGKRTGLALCGATMPHAADGVFCEVCESILDIPGTLARIDRRIVTRD